MTLLNKTLLATLMLVSACADDPHHALEVEALTQAASVPSSGPCPSGVLRVVDGFGAVMTPDTFILEDNGVRFDVALKGPSGTESPDHYRRAWLSPTSYGRGASLAYEVRACTEACASDDSEVYMQKVNHHILYSDPEAGLVFGERRNIGFAFKLTREQPLGDTILFQLWQGGPHGPPMAAFIRSENDGSLSLLVEARNNDTGSNPSILPERLGGIRDLQMDTWYSIVLSLFPENTAMEHRSGNVTIGMQYKREDDTGYRSAFSYFGKWGYVPGSRCQYAGDCTTSGANKSIDFKVGIYRHAENTALQVRFDNIKLTRSHWQARPEYWCDWSL